MTENDKSIRFRMEIQKNKFESSCLRGTTQNCKLAVDVMKFTQGLCHPDGKKKKIHNSLAKSIMSND